MSPEKCKSHGIARKGGAVHITTSSMAPPPLPSVCARGEWSMGHILDVYLRFSDPGDCDAGRILAGLPVDSMTFMAMPPTCSSHDQQGTNGHCIERKLWANSIYTPRI